MSQSKTRILCVEDDGDTCELTRTILGAKGYEVVAINTTTGALRLIAADGFSLYIVNEKLPDGCGIDFIRRVRQSGSLTPILIHSAAAYSQDIEKGLQAGADEYLVKPDGWPKLVETVERLLHQSLSAK